MKKIAINALLVMAGLVVAMVLAEIFLRLIGYSRPQLYRPDPCCGFSLRPHAEGLWDEEGEDYIVINSRGLRDEEHALAKPDNTFRIAVLGDSYAEAFQLPMSRAFWSVLEEELRRRDCLSGMNIEAINFGVSGYGTAQELLTLRKKVWDYDPDLIIVALHTGNDIRNNHRTLEGDPKRPYFVLENSELRLDDSFLENPQYQRRASERVKFVVKVVSWSRLLQLLNELRQKLFAPERTAGSDPATMQHEPGLDTAVFLPPASQNWKEAWRVTEAIIRRMDQDVKEKHRQFLLVTLSMAIQVHPDPRVRKQLMEKLGVENLFYPDERICEMAEKHGISNLMLAPRLRDWAVRNNTCLHGFDNTELCKGHWNEQGHRVAGKLIAETICSMVSGSPDAPTVSAPP